MSRLPTVYDFSSLQLHPDGSRVPQNSEQNLKTRYAAGAVQDARGNWFARDAAGLGMVGKYRTVREGKKKEEEEGNASIVCEDEDQHSVRKGKGKTRADGSSGRRRNPRPAKRRKFMENYDFLAPGLSTSEQTLPSSDLLKSIHYFASCYYHERGQLFNVTKEYRQMRRQNKRKRLQQQKTAEEVGDDSGEWEDGSEDSRLVQKGGRKKGVVGRTIHRKDMYKILDGSALMALGMLMQEYVARTLEIRIPDGWEEMMREAYSRASAGEDEGGIEEENSEHGVSEGTSDENDEDDEDRREEEDGGEDGKNNIEGEEDREEVGSEDRERDIEQGDDEDGASGSEEQEDSDSGD